MELTNEEKKLIEAIREMDEPAYNILLWYKAGKEHARNLSKSIGDDYRVEQDQKHIDTVHKHLINWDK